MDRCLQYTTTETYAESSELLAEKSRERGHGAFRHMSRTALKEGSRLLPSLVSVKASQIEMYLDDVRKSISEDLPSRIGAAFICPPATDDNKTYCDEYFEGSFSSYKYMYKVSIAESKNKGDTLPKLHLTDAETFTCFTEAYYGWKTKLGHQTEEDVRQYAEMYWLADQTVEDTQTAEIIVNPASAVVVGELIKSKELRGGADDGQEGGSERGRAVVVPRLAPLPPPPPRVPPSRPASRKNMPKTHQAKPKGNGVCETLLACLCCCSDKKQETSGLLSSVKYSRIASAEFTL